MRLIKYAARRRPLFGTATLADPDFSLDAVRVL